MQDSGSMAPSDLGTGRAAGPIHTVKGVHRSSAADRWAHVRELPRFPGPTDSAFEGLLRRGGLPLCAVTSGPGRGSPWTLIAWEGEGWALGAGSMGGLRAELERRGALPLAGAPRGWPEELACAPFQGGVVLALGYELGVEGHKLALPAEPWNWPAAAGWLPRVYTLHEHQSGRMHLVSEGDSAAGAKARGEAVWARLTGAGEVLPGSQASARSGWLAPGAGIVRHTRPFVHRARVEALRRAIREGQVYQANLAHRMTAQTQADPLELHLALRRAFPAPYGGLFQLPHCAEQGLRLWSSHSPELLLDAEGDQLCSRPIKGTAPRSEDPDLDRRLAEGLLRSPKERAELAMIVDLVRNDLGRVARAGGVWVREREALESYPGVHHKVATVEAKLRPELDLFAALESLFPAASITGAPKLAAMENIAQLEREGRGFFCGSLGFFSHSGRAVFNVGIRSPLWRARAELGPLAGELSLRVGGGITYDSDPAEEDRETLHKASAFLRALAGPRSEGA